MRTQWLLPGIVVGFVVTLALPAMAGAPMDHLKQRVDEVIKVVDDPALSGKPTERHAAVRKIAEDIFDYPDTAQRALGVHWNSRSPQERQEFVQLFADLL